MPVYIPPVTRRAMMKTAVGGGMLLARRPASADHRVTPNRIALMADIHVWGDAGKVIRGVRSTETAGAAFRQIAADNDVPSKIIVAGDCAAMTGRTEDYAMIRTLIEPVRRAGVGVYFALGNHDQREHFLRAFPEADAANKSEAAADKHVCVLETEHADFILLDSLDKTNVCPGLMGKKQLAWLDRHLGTNADKPALVVAHHNPDRRKKPSGLIDTDALFAVLRKHPRARAYLFGHVHRWGCNTQQQICQLSIPTTAWLFQKEQPRGWVDASLEKKRARFTLHALDGTHPKHGQTHALVFGSG